MIAIGVPAKILTSDDDYIGHEPISAYFSLCVYAFLGIGLMLIFLSFFGSCFYGDSRYRISTVSATEPAEILSKFNFHYILDILHLAGRLVGAVHDNHVRAQKSH